jgi:putative PIN family toxin of toxin-antitoxin system
MTSVILDTNIIVSAIVFGGKPREIFELVLSGTIQSYFSSFMIFELKEVLAKKFQFSDEKLQGVEDIVREAFIYISPRKSVTLIKNCIPDNHILEAAQESEANYLITGDKKHILPLKKIKKTQIVTPEDFLKIITP